MGLFDFWKNLTPLGRVTVVFITLIFITLLSLTVFPPASVFDNVIKQTPSNLENEVIIQYDVIPITELSSLKPGFDNDDPNTPRISVTGGVTRSTDKTKSLWIELDGYFVAVSGESEENFNVKYGDVIVVNGSLLESTHNLYTLHSDYVVKTGSGYTLSSFMNVSEINDSLSNRFVNVSGHLSDIGIRADLLDDKLFGNFTVANATFLMYLFFGDNSEFSNYIFREGNYSLILGVAGIGENLVLVPYRILSFEEAT